MSGHKVLNQPCGLGDEIARISRAENFQSRVHWNLHNSFVSSRRKNIGKQDRDIQLTDLLRMFAMLLIVHEGVWRVTLATTCGYRGQRVACLLLHRLNICCYCRGLSSHAQPSFASILNEINSAVQYKYVSHLLQAFTCWSGKYCWAFCS